MSDDIVVVDNGSTYETQESAIVAKNEADRAEQWAKYSEEKANLADERAVDAAESSNAAAQAATDAIEAKQYAETVITDENLIVVATDLKSTPSNIKKTAGSIDNVNTVSNDIENINAVAANKANIDKVAADKDNIDTVATNILNVKTVAKNIDNVNLLAPHTEAMEALAPDIMDVVTVAGITEQTKNVSENMTAVVDVSNNKTNINNVASNIAAVNNVSDNMADVKNAVQSANDAELWAVGTIAEKPEGSSKYWAEQAEQAAQVYDATETIKGIVRLATSDEVTAGTNNSAAITPLKLKQKIAQNLTNPSADTVPSTKAVKDESSRITTLMDNYVKKSGDTMSGLLDTKSHFRTRGRTTRIVEVNSLDNSQTWGTYEVYKLSDTETHSAIFAFNPSDNNKNATINIHIKGDEKWADCPSSKRNNSIVTTEYMGSNYVRFGNGLQICWGITARENISTVYLPQAFKDNAYIVLALPSEGSSNTSDLYVHSKTTTQFKLQEQIQKPEQRQWLALGYWY